MNAGSGTVEIGITNLNENSQLQSENVKKEVLTVEASIKPFISLVWIGVILTVIGFIFSAYRRSKESLT